MTAAGLAPTRVGAAADSPFTHLAVAPGSRPITLPGQPAHRPPSHPAGAAVSTGSAAAAARRNAVGLSPRSRLKAALKPNASA